MKPKTFTTKQGIRCGSDADLRALLAYAHAKGVPVAIATEEALERPEPLAATMLVWEHDDYPIGRYAGDMSLHAQPGRPEGGLELTPEQFRSCCDHYAEAQKSRQRPR
ncbi:hypothetical protein [Solirubrum puertoriconensis]|uniref:Uncharacterized protein n=1 Tax=Solirubrum puertoriconensis TaxID=1751427 RepID=A0A9X0L5W0_SOLP1|nr:hypothetical protein [Solirubrum puertoriconensis]KUG09019.1 hypothetical protein ASU33_19540 [Solirubrum puertoriconensis]